LSSLALFQKNEYICARKEEMDIMYTLYTANCKHEPVHTFARAFDLFRDHVHVSITSGSAACNYDDGYYPIVELDGQSHILDIRKTVSLAEYVGLFNDDSSIRFEDATIDARVAQILFDDDSIHAIAWHLGLLDPFM